MADTVTSIILENGPRRVVMAFTNVSDGTGESGVVKVNATSSGSLGVVVAGQTYYPGVNLKVVDVWYDIGSMKLAMAWDNGGNASTNFMVVGGYGRWPMLDSRGGFQGFVNPNNSGATGSVKFTTIGAALNSTYSVVLSMTKGVPQS
jgi:hypothetical protein